MLRSLLFLIYINDTPKSVNDPMMLFAGVCTVIYESETNINNSLNSILMAEYNNLVINLDKIKIMFF